MSTHYPVVIVGGGQAGLSLSYYLAQQGLDHLVLEKNQIGHAWRSERWDSFCLVTPNWQCTLPDFDYSGPEPEGFMVRDEIVDYLESFVKSFNPPIQEGVEVVRLKQQAGGFQLTTSQGELTTDQVVVATGAYHRPKIPAIANQFPRHIIQLHSRDYKSPEGLPDQPILVVGTGQSGCQIAEDLHLAGKQVHLCVGSAPRSPRRYRGKDVVDWLHRLGYYDLTVDEHPDKENVRHKTNHYLTGRDGGREIDLRQFALEGMKLYGRLTDIGGTKISFQADLKQNLARADDVAASIKRTIDKFIADNGIDAPEETPYVPVWEPEGASLLLDWHAANIGSVIWCLGFDSDFRWVEIPVFNGKGYPAHHRGITTIPGLYFLGLPWLHTWGSGRFSGISRDAGYIAKQILTRQQFMGLSNINSINEVALGS
ncbi:MAG: MSMEG_0569 family flavin-dependent oxidoreductase [Cyanobacteria bacterium P01_H01_bin.15]